jgi:hypothetical protein
MPAPTENNVLSPEITRGMPGSSATSGQAEANAAISSLMSAFAWPLD